MKVNKPVQAGNRSDDRLEMSSSNASALGGDQVDSWSDCSICYSTNSCDTTEPRAQAMPSSTQDLVLQVVKMLNFDLTTSTKLATPVSSLGAIFRIPVALS